MVSLRFSIHQPGNEFKNVNHFVIHVLSISFPIQRPLFPTAFLGFCAACAEAISVTGADLWHCPRTP